MPERGICLCAPDKPPGGGWLRSLASYDLPILGKPEGVICMCVLDKPPGGG